MAPATSKRGSDELEVEMVEMVETKTTNNRAGTVQMQVQVQAEAHTHS